MDWFFLASFPAVVLVPTSCEVALGTGVVTAVGKEKEKISVNIQVPALSVAWRTLWRTWCYCPPGNFMQWGRRSSHTLVLLLSGPLSWGLAISNVFQRR